MSQLNPEFASFRMPSWEEDISRNHDTHTPFENEIPPCQMARDAFDVPNHLTAELLNGRPIEHFISNDALPIPPSNDREGYNVNHDASFFLNGLADYLKVCHIAKKYKIEMQSYFDFGCAAGRVLRHFCTHSEVPVVWGSDINGRHIKWLNDFMPAKLKIIHNHAIPRLPIASNSIDVISAFSVFTHLDIFETAWLAELRRILRPGGMVFLTVQNNESWKYVQESTEDQYMRAHMRQRVPNFDDVIQQELPNRRVDFRLSDLGPYRAIVFHANEYLYRTWGRFFEIPEIIPLYHGYHQSVFVGLKQG